MCYNDNHIRILNVKDMDLLKKKLFDALFTLAVLALVFVINLLVETYFSVYSLIPMISILGVFLISRKTSGYFWGLLASVISVFIVNYAFTFPYNAFNFSLPENLVSAIIMIIVAVMTSTLTTQLIEQEKMRAENEKEKMRANLLRAMSHDIRTPLTSIYGSVSTMLEHYDLIEKPQHLKMLQDIQDDAKSLIRMVENLLSITRIGGENVKLIKAPVVLAELVDDTLSKFRKHYPDQPVQVSIPDTFICIPMDALLIEQVIINLLENAVFHAEGMTQLSLRVYTVGREAVFEVADDGCGFQPERIAVLLSGRPVLSSTAPIDGKRNNMGIGLFLCATIIRAHGRTLQAENRKTGGAAFRFSLEMETETDGE